MKKYHYETATLRLPNGKRKYVRGKTKEELKQKLDALKRELLCGIDIGNETTFQQYAEHWFKTVKEPYITENTAELNRYFFRTHIYPYIGAVKMRDIKPANIREIMLRSADLCHGSQQKILGLLRAVFNMAVDDSILLKSPVPATLKAAGAKTEEAEALTTEQEQLLLEAAQGTTAYPFVVVMLQTGLRRGEVTALMWSDIDYENEVIHVRRHVVTDKNGKPDVVQGAKTESGVRDVPLTPGLAAFLKTLPRSSVYVFTTANGTVYSSAAFSCLWRTLQDRVPFKIKSHLLRHTYATKLFEAGLDLKQIQYVLGHANAETTLKTYTHYRESVRRANTLQQVKEALG